jgi:hypothetical protein
MSAPRSRRPTATGALPFIALGFCCVFLAACASPRGRTPQSPPRTPAAELPGAPLHPVIGRILHVDLSNATAVVELAPGPRSAPFFPGDALIARRLDTLAPTARLRVAPYQSGRMLGVYLVSGTPSPQDEVALAPARAEAAATPPTP